MPLTEPSEFGLFLKEKRKAANLKQDELAAAIGRSGQYISNIEKGKNNAPPKESDIEILIEALGLDKKDSRKFREKAAADRSRLPRKQMDYLFTHRNLLELINYGIENNISDKRWEDVLRSIAGGIADDIK